MVASVAILLLVSIGLGVQKDVTKQVADLGANVIVCVPGRVNLTTFNPNLGGQSWFKEDDAERLSKVQGVKQVALLSFAGGGARKDGKEAYPLIIAASPEWFAMHEVELAGGRLYTKSDYGKKVVVLGGIAAKEIFTPTEDPVGQSIEINQGTYEIIGVTADKVAEESLFSMQSLDNIAYIPYGTFLDVSPDAQIDRFMVQTEPTAEPRQLVERLENALDERLDRQQFSVLTQEDLLGLIFSVMGILQTLVVGLTSIALFVGGIGIMAIMMLGVNERRKEIGVRRAVGATSREVFVQILIESIAIGLAGVVAGLIISLIVAACLSAWTSIKPEMTAGVLALAFGVGIGVGALSGVLPAIRASRQDPAASLRNE